MTERLYAARIDGWIAGRRMKRGQTLTLTEDAARSEPVVPVDADRDRTAQTPPPAAARRRKPRAGKAVAQ